MINKISHNFPELDPELPEEVHKLTLPGSQTSPTSIFPAQKFKIEPIIRENIAASPISSTSSRWWVGLTIKCGFCSESFLLDEDYPVIEIIERSIPLRHFARFKCDACSQSLSQEQLEKSAPKIFVNPLTPKSEIFQPRNFKKSRAEEPELHDLDSDINDDFGGTEIDRLQVPERINIKTRTFEPNLETLLVQPVVEKSLPENHWGEQKTEIKKLPWRWYALISLAIISAIFWSKYSYQTMQKMHSSSAEISQNISNKPPIVEKVNDDFEVAKAASMQMDQMTAAMRGYLSATSIDELARYVRHPERVRPLMEDYYKNHPIVANPMTRNLPSFDYIESEPGKNFWVGTCELKDGQIVKAYVEILTTGESKVDWETMVYHQPMSWDDYSKKRLIGEPMNFRVYIENGYQFSDEFEDRTTWRCYRLTSKDSEAIIYGYIKAGSPLEKELTQQIEANKSKKCPVILRLNIPVKLKAKQSVIIEKVVSKYWVIMNSSPSTDQ